MIVLEISNVSLVEPITFSTIWSTWTFTSNFSESHIWFIVDTTENVSWSTLKFAKFSICVDVNFT